MKVERKHLFVISVVLIAVFHVILFIPIIPVAESSPSKTYNLDPNDRPATFEVVSTEFIETWSLGRGEYVKSKIVLNNTDSYGGIFKVAFSFFNQSLDAKTGDVYQLVGEIDTVYEFLDWKIYRGNGVIGVINIDGGIPLVIPTVDHVTTEIFVESGKARSFSATFDAQDLREINCGYTVSPPRIRTVYKSIMELLLGS
jgi:hypothetical protein